MVQPPDPLNSRYKILSQKRHLKMLAGASGGLTVKKMSRPERLFKSVLRKASAQFSVWKLAWAEFGRRHPRVKRVPGWTAVFVFTGLGQSILGLLALFYAVAPWYVWPLTLFVSATLGEAFVIHYSSIAYERAKREAVEKLEDEIWQLEDRLQPKLEISYADGADDHVVRSTGNEIRHRTVRIRIENAGNEVIEGVKVKAEKFLNFGDIPLYDTPLRIAHDLNNDKRNGFAISPGDRERADVVSKAYGSPDIYLCHALGKDFLALTRVARTKDFVIKVRGDCYRYSTPRGNAANVFG